MPLSLHCKKFMNTLSRGVAVYFSQTSQYSSSDLSVYPHQGQNRCIFYKDESLQQEPARATTPGCWLVTPSPGAPVPRCVLSCVYECADMLLSTKYESDLLIYLIYSPKHQNLLPGRAHANINKSLVLPRILLEVSPGTTSDFQEEEGTFWFW